MELRSETRDGCLIVSPDAEELRFDQSMEFKRELAALADGCERPMVLDLSRVCFVDSTALSALIATRNRLHMNGHPFAVAAANKYVRDLAGLLSLDRFLSIRDSVDEAVAAIVQG